MDRVLLLGALAVMLQGFRPLGKEQVAEAEVPLPYPWPLVEVSPPEGFPWRILLPGRDIYGRKLDTWSDRLWLLGQVDAPVSGAWLSAVTGRAEATWSEPRPISDVADVGLSPLWSLRGEIWRLKAAWTWQSGTLSVWQAVYIPDDSDDASVTSSRTMLEIRPWPPIPSVRGPEVSSLPCCLPCSPRVVRDWWPTHQSGRLTSGRT